MKTLKKYIELAIKEVEQSIRHGYHNDNIVKHLEDIMSPNYSENEILINCINAQFSWGHLEQVTFPSLEKVRVQSLILIAEKLKNK